MVMQVSESLQCKVKWWLKDVLEGKKYNRGVRLHKMVYKPLFRMLLNNFDASLPAHAIDLSTERNSY